MSSNTITLSSKGQLALPKAIRETDALAQGDVFRLERQAAGQYLLQKLALVQPPAARLVRKKDGLLAFRVPDGASKISAALVKQLEAETV
jgi:bifunctional DNA-binding transcriptional regulator/antitoxin component of YhaV-PrlF toxin-antitoxin module